MLLSACADRLRIVALKKTPARSLGKLRRNTCPRAVPILPTKIGGGNSHRVLGASGHGTSPGGREPPEPVIWPGSLCIWTGLGTPLKPWLVALANPANCGRTALAVPRFEICVLAKLTF